jgi:pantothenate kinase
MDGFHLTRAQLAEFPDPPGPSIAIARRGAAFTFDAVGWVRFVQRLRANDEDVWAPSFDHAVKDPVVHGVKVERKHKIVILEGLYVMVRTEALLADR